MLVFMLLQAVAPPPPSTTGAIDWPSLAPMPFVAPPQVTPPLARFVADEIAAGRCAVPRPADGRYVVKVDVAAQIGADGSVRRAVPHAIDCPTVEQYSAGLVISFARANLKPGLAADQWYRATIVYEWAG